MSTDSLLLSYIPIYLGVALLLFNRQITVAYEKHWKRKRKAFPKIITSIRVLIGGLILIVAGMWNLIASSI